MATKTIDGTAYPASCFLVVPDPSQPSGWRLPVKDPDGTPNHRLMGQAWAALNSNFRGQAYDGPDKEKAMGKLIALYKSEGMDLPSVTNSRDDGVVTDAVGFAQTAETREGATVIRTGKLFQTGDYPDKAFSLTPEEMDAAIAGFSPAPVDIGDAHVPTLLEGKMGSVQRIWREGEALMGEVHLPAWLDGLLEDGERKVSTEWNRLSKRLERLCLVKNPRVTDAALMSAYTVNGGPAEEMVDRLAGILAAFAATRHDTASGQAALQAIHDTAVANGARCRAKPASMASNHESDAMQAIHDVTMMHGATCDRVNSSTAGSSTGPPPAAKWGTSTRTFSSPRRARMNLMEWLTGKAKEDGFEIDPAELTTAFSGEDPAARQKIAALEAEIATRDAANATLKAEQEIHAQTLARFAAERRHSEAVTFAQTQVAAHRVTPGAAEKLAALHERISTLDASATFSEGEQPTAALLAEFVTSLPDLSVFTTEAVGGVEDLAGLFSIQTTPENGGNDKVRPDVVRRALEATVAGREVLKTRNGGNPE